MNLAWGRPWNAAEDAVVRRLYAQGAAAVVRELVGRTVGAVHARAKAIGVNRPEWTQAEETRLRSLWGSKSLPELAIAFERTEWAVYQRSRDLGLGALPQGMEWISGAEVRTGYHARTLLRILTAAKVRIGESLSVQKAGKGPRSFRRRFVDPFDVDEAIRRWQATETLASAAQRRGVTPKRLRRALRGLPGVPNRPGRAKCWRIPTELIDQALGLAAAAAVHDEGRRAA